MMQHEFEARTGIYVTNSMYATIEREYYEFDGDKDTFCRAYKENADGLAERIKRKFLEAEAFKPNKGELKASKPTREEEDWKPYVDRDRVSKEDYARLASVGRELTTNEAIQLIADEYGFDISKIIIISEIDELEINRFHQLRTTGRKIDRRPYYEATDWFYVRFYVKTIAWSREYEAWNGLLLAA